ncbi:hypothetical protein AQJ43_29475 [Streptomyces avermitilis]|nr:hypothetical protein AQJ43_29475 [Streptomyces avermitilis]
MLAPEIHPTPKSTKHVGRAQVVIGGTARETQVRFDAEARAWATTGPTTTAKNRAAVPAQPGPTQLQKPTAPAALPVRSDSSRRCRSDWDKAIGHLQG